MAEKDTEIVLGTGKLLGLFFGLVILCALFLGLGYNWGRKSAQSSPLELTADQGDAGAGGSKPLASSTQPPAASENCPNGNCGGTQGEPAVSAPAPENAQVTQPAVELQTPPATAPAPSAAAKSVPVPVKAASTISGYLVQVAAVSKQEDAEALAAALRQKQYPVFISPGTLSDKYFHVQVGPFPDEKQADAMKSKLLGDGYNAIVKR